MEAELINYLNKLLPFLTDEELNLEYVSSQFKEGEISIDTRYGLIKGNYSTDYLDIYFQYNKHLGWKLEY